MVSNLIDHIGFMVSDLDEAIKRWTKATGYTFRPPSKYTVEDYRDTDNPEPHLSDVRLYRAHGALRHGHAFEAVH